MKRLLIVVVLLMSTSVFAQTHAVGSGEDSAKYLIQNIDVRLLAGKPQLLAVNGLDEAIDSITCTNGSKTWTLVGSPPDKSVPRNTKEIAAGRASIIDVDGWSGYCPAGLVAHTQTMDVRGELNIPNDFDKSVRVVFWRRNAS